MAPLAPEGVDDEGSWQWGEVLPWRRDGHSRLYNTGNMELHSVWKYLRRKHPEPESRCRILSGVLHALDVAPELVLPEKDVLLELASKRPPPQKIMVRDRANGLARKLARNLRSICYIAPRECVASGQDFTRLCSLGTERLAMAFDIEPEELPAAAEIDPASSITHRRWTHLGWRQHRRAVDMLRDRIVRDARELVTLAPACAAWLEGLAAQTESLPDCKVEHAGWIEMEPKATYLLWARTLDHLVYGRNDLPQCQPDYLRWQDFDVIARALFGIEQVPLNAPQLIGAAVSKQRAAPFCIETFADTR